jgi:hypothetical protein
MRNTENPTAERNVVRNGHRWRVAAINTPDGRIGAHRLDDHTAATFPADYVREHVSLGYAVTVHSAQGAPPTPPMPYSGRAPPAACSTSP